jgi:transcriptional regulator with XRE-family HTH domain
LLNAADQEPERFTKALAIGSRLRAMRHLTGLSLVAVEAMSDQEFRASVLSSYERGERAISVTRLQRLAKFYNIPVYLLLPPEDVSRFRWAETEDTGASPASPHPALLGSPEKITIDLVKLLAGVGPERELLRRFLNAIQVQRQDFNGRMMTIRTRDVSVIACMLGVTPDAMGHRLDDLGLRVV